MEELSRQWQRERSKFKSDAKIKECFHFDKSECNGKIKSAHSLQKNGVLSILEYEQNKNKVVYSLLHPKLNGFMTFNGFESLGKKECSTFHGFCDYHDTSVFAPIENNEIDVDKDEHCFLLCYRAFAKEFHAKIEVNKGFRTNKTYNKPHNYDMQNWMITGTELAINDLEKVKIKLNNALRDKQYSALEYFTYSIPRVIPIACSASITPSYSYSGIVLNKSSDPNDKYENIMITVFPTKSETHVVMGCFSEDQKSIKFIDELEQLNNEKLENALTSIMIGDIENTFISPLIWKKMLKKEREYLMQELTLTSPMIMAVTEDIFFLSNLNFFDHKFSIK